MVFVFNKRNFQMSKKNKKTVKTAVQVKIEKGKLVATPVSGFFAYCRDAITSVVRSATAAVTTTTSRVKTACSTAAEATKQKVVATKAAVVSGVTFVYTKTATAIRNERARVFAASVIIGTGVIVVSVCLGTLAGLAAGGLAMVAGASPLVAQVVHFIVAMTTTFFVIGGITKMLECSPSYSFAQ
jgi:hypothetical protein